LSVRLCQPGGVVSNIVYWLADNTGCGQYRCLLPGEALRERGHTVTADETVNMNWIDNADVFVGQRIGKPGPSVLWQAVARDESRTAKLVYELDDDVFALADEPSNPNHRTWPALLGNVKANLACADAVTVSTDRLASVVSEHTSAPVHVVPNAVPDALLDKMLPLRVQPRTLGWSGSATHDGDWAHDDNASRIVNWLANSRTAQHDQWLLRTLGSQPAPLDDALDRETKRVWHLHANGTPSLWRYYILINRWFDIGLAPLAPSEFNRSKSDLRLLELAALGIPWIASDFGPYAYGTPDTARGGLRVNGNRGWFEALTAVASDEDMRRELRMQGRVWARTRTISEVLPRWEAAFGLTE
jgi:glycosyltransferase involved in cell wall biosynthesis